MADEITTWDPGSFRDGVEKKIREVFVDLIPEEAFSKMVADSIARFSAPQEVTVRDHHGRNTSVESMPSQLDDIVNGILKDAVEARVKNILNGAEWTVNYEGVIGAKLAALIEEATPAIIHNMITGIVRNMIQNAQSNGMY